MPGLPSYYFTLFKKFQILITCRRNRRQRTATTRRRKADSISTILKWRSSRRTPHTAHRAGQQQGA